MSSNDLNYNEDIIKQLITFGIGTRNEIISAMNQIVNKNDINEIIDYLNNNKEKQINYMNYNVKSNILSVLIFANYGIYLQKNI